MPSLLRRSQTGTTSSWRNSVWFLSYQTVKFTPLDVPVLYTHSSGRFVFTHMVSPSFHELHPLIVAEFLTWFEGSCASFAFQFWAEPHSNTGWVSRPSPIFSSRLGRLPFKRGHSVTSTGRPGRLLSTREDSQNIWRGFKLFTRTSNESLSSNMLFETVRLRPFPWIRPSLARLEKLRCQNRFRTSARS
jgi:hypothetical protein